MPRWTFEVNPLTSLDAVARGDGVWLPPRVVAKLDDPERPYRARLTWALDTASLEYRCVGVESNARSNSEIKGSDLHLPLARLWDEVWPLIEPFCHGVGDPAPRGTVRRDLPRDRQGGIASYKTGQPMRRRRRLSRAFLEEIADIYKRAEKEGRPPRAAIVEHFADDEYPPTRLTARNWIQAARAEGLLTEQGTKRSHRLKEEK
jgi:hypothetical protein